MISTVIVIIIVGSISLLSLSLTKDGSNRQVSSLNYNVTYAEPDKKIDLSLVPHTVNITGLKKNYKVGEPIDFTIILRGNGTFCKGYDLQVHNLTSGRMWGNKAEQNLCSIEPLAFERIFQYSSYPREKYTISDKLIVDDIPQADQYEANYAIVFVTGYGDVVNRTFTVTNLSDSVNNTQVDKNSNNESSKEYGTTSLPPPFSVKNIGSKATTLDDALNQAGLTQVFAPTYIPDGLVLDSTRLTLDPNGNRILILYMPDGQSVTDETTVQEVIDKGMAVEISREQKDPNFNWDDFVKQSVKENPTIRSSTIINNHEVLLIRNNPEINYPNMVKFMADDIRIEIASAQFGTNELEEVMRSIMKS